VRYPPCPSQHTATCARITHAHTRARPRPMPLCSTKSKHALTLVVLGVGHCLLSWPNAPCALGLLNEK
jgi:hypothetical protein